MPIATGVLDAGRVVIPDPNYHFYVGRKTFTNGQVANSKIERNGLKQWYINQSGAEVGDQATEILVCKP
jgi:aspartate/methionine/tyrosine aminotransferase